MARTKAFDVDEVLDRAVDLFWLNGFAATSVEDLVQHLGINRGSLYATFGSKDELYQRALRRYLESSVGWLIETLTETEDSTLRQRLQTVLEAGAVSADHRGCFMVNTATERNANDPGCQGVTAEALSRMRRVIVEAFEAAGRTGGPGNEIVGPMSPTAAAELVTVTIQGLRVVSTIDVEQGLAANVIEATLDAIFGRPSTESSD